MVPRHIKDTQVEDYRRKNAIKDKNNEDCAVCYTYTLQLRRTIRKKIYLAYSVLLNSHHGLPLGL